MFIFPPKILLAIGISLLFHLLSAYFYLDKNSLLSSQRNSQTIKTTFTLLTDRTSHLTTFPQYSLSSLSVKNDKKEQIVATQKEYISNIKPSSDSIVRTYDLGNEKFNPSGLDDRVYLDYIATIHKKIEQMGARLYPQDQSGKKMLGQLTILLTVGAKGNVQACQVTHSSKNLALDEAACQIVDAAQPFGPFPSSMVQLSHEITFPKRMLFIAEDGMTID